MSLYYLYNNRNASTVVAAARMYATHPGVLNLLHRWSGGYNTLYKSDKVSSRPIILLIHGDGESDRLEGARHCGRDPVSQRSQAV